MTLVEATGPLVALFSQNELHQVENGNEAEFALGHTPGPHRQGEGGLDHLGAGRRAGTGQRDAADDRRAHRTAAALRREVRRRRSATGSSSSRPARRAPLRSTANHAEFLHIIRKIILRVGSYLNYLVLKLH